ncbi:MAG: methylmalonyl Co-A mutase-associated GTPase MeaB [Chloroflexi bacterium]|nr:methylmalonyl Co-A mutase-associated GTPase MeaB [Chloroflexota bacterium]
MAELPPVRHKSADELAEGVLRGERRALARLMSAVEDGRSDAQASLTRLYSHTSRTHVVGITGPPGSGKSTLTTRIAAEARRRGRTVGIVAVDPTSPFTGGAILGDRVRMMELHGDPDVFVRSMATRGTMGGLARGTSDVVLLLAAFGKDVVLVETVGVGQDEVDIARSADTTLVVGVPGLGDDIQAIKAGVLEIADILVVNKADLEGAHRSVNELRGMLSLAPKRSKGMWQVPIHETMATTGGGVGELVDRIDKHRTFLETSGTWHLRRAESARREVQAIVQQRIGERVERLVSDRGWGARFAAIAARQEDPYTLAEEILATPGLLEP